MQSDNKYNFRDKISFKHIRKARRRQIIGLVTGLIFSSAVVITLSYPSNEMYLCKGPLNTGHEKLECSSCHKQSEGTTRQQMQAKVRYLFSMRKADVDFGKENVENKTCVECHTRDNDRHPVHRFSEPRFEAARAKLGIDKCESCHKEHSGTRVTLNELTYCQECHSDLKLENDPLDVAHHTLISQSQWNTCIQCHDFHGNHEMLTATKLKDTIPQKLILQYLNGGIDPFSRIKVFKAKSIINNEK